jgi:hypothetical protein
MTKTFVSALGQVNRRPDGQITSVPTSLSAPLVKPLLKKYSGCQNILIILYCSLSRPTKGALRNVNNAGRDAVDADVPLTNGADADGEGAWSWHPDAGVKFA